MLPFLHLDDHVIFQAGIHGVFRKYLRKIQIQVAPDNSKALAYVKECLVNDKKLDLIITDFNHPNGNGIEFVEEVRILEKDFYARIPIPMHTMVGEIEVIKKALDDGSLDAYLCKIAQEHKLMSVIHGLLSKAEGYEETMKSIQ